MRIKTYGSTTGEHPTKVAKITSHALAIRFSIFTLLLAAVLLSLVVRNLEWPEQQEPKLAFSPVLDRGVNVPREYSMLIQSSLGTSGKDGSILLSEAASLVPLAAAPYNEADVASFKPKARNIGLYFI